MVSFGSYNLLVAIRQNVDLDDSVGLKLAEGVQTISQQYFILMHTEIVNSLQRTARWRSDAD